MWGKYLGLCCPRGRADFLVVVVDVGAIFFYLQKMMQKSFFQKNKLSGDIGLTVQMHNLNFVAAAVSNY